jgi:hypothetical protein
MNCQSHDTAVLTSIENSLEPSDIRPDGRSRDTAVLSPIENSPEPSDIRPDGQSRDTAVWAWNPWASGS